MTEQAASDLRMVHACADALAPAAREFAALGWTPATSSNFSMRVDARRAAITVSGRDKGALTRDDFMLVDMDGRALDPAATPSAETALHTQIYRRFADVRAVLHTHSRTQSVASRHFAADGVIRLSGWELQKAISGLDSHECTLELPVFANSQRMPELVAAVDAWLDSGKPLFGYLIEGHGIYTWGQNLAAACRHLEALEFLLACELDLLRLKQ